MKNNKGATTIVVICVMAVIMTLSMGLFLTASVMIRTSGRTLAAEQSKILAISLSEELEEKLCSANGDALGTYIRKNISDGSWPYYQEEEGNLHSKEHAIRSFALQKDGMTGEIADVTISIYWVPEETGGSELWKQPKQVVVKTTVEVKQQKSSILDIYECEGAAADAGAQWSFKHVDRS